jgi:hypothetical protein
VDESKLPSQKYLAGIKTYIFAGTAVLLFWVVLMWGPDHTHEESIVLRMIQAVESIVLFVAGKAVASKAVDAIKIIKARIS